MSSCGKITGISTKLLIPTTLVWIALVSCSSPIKIEGFNDEGWRSDTNACYMKRTNWVALLLQQKEAFTNKKEEELTKYIGKPDKTLFFARGKKTLIYQVDPGKNCENRVLVKNPRTVRFDINALGRVELVYQIAQ
jgi:hypothetical protein